jgi:hypothetical protein
MVQSAIHDTEETKQTKETEETEEKVIIFQMAHPVLQSLQGRLVPATNNPVLIGHAYIVIKLGVNKCKKIQGGFLVG